MDPHRYDGSNSILVQRDAAMISLIAHGQTLLTRLALLTQVEKEAVLALVVIGQAVVGYAHGIHPDCELIECFKRTLEALSPERARRAMPHNQLYGCQEQAFSYARAVANCCEPDTAAEAAAVAEIACYTLHLKALHAVLVPSQQRPGEAREAASLVDTKLPSHSPADKTGGD